MVHYKQVFLNITIVFNYAVCRTLNTLECIQRRSESDMSGKAPISF